MADELEEVIEMLRGRGVTMDQLEKKYGEIDGGIDWDRVVKDKKFLDLHFPDPRKQMENLDEAVEKHEDRITELEEEVGKLSAASMEHLEALKRLDMRFREASSAASFASIVAIIALIASVILAGLMWFY